jgi:exopolyphosphatase/pppGpp-phosphohydrolase
VTTLIAELESDFVAVACALAAGGAAQSNGPVTLLHIGEEKLVVLSGSGSTIEAVRQADVGASRIARDFFRHDPPSPLEIERAIDVTEDEIMRLGKPDRVASSLFSTSEALRPWAALTGPVMTSELVESWFQRLASAALRQPQTMKGLPSGREAAAALLVLREFMHHCGHTSIVYL